MSPKPAISVEELRSRIREIEGQSVRATRWETGVRCLDDLLGGLPVPGVMEVTSLPGGGGVSVALAVAAQLTQAGQWVAWLDTDRTLYPPGLRLQGVALERLVIVRPIADRGAWSADLLVSSGCFPWVVISGDVSLGGSGARWTRAVEKGHCCMCVIRAQSERGLPAQVRLRVSDSVMTVMRNRGGRVGGSAPIPALAVEPWP